MPLTTSLNGVAFASSALSGYVPGMRIIVDASITISDASIAAIDALGGGAWTGSVTLNSVSYETSEGVALGTFSTPGSITVTVAALQRSGAGSRLIRGNVSYLLGGTAAYPGTAFCTAFQTVGSTTINDAGAAPPAGTPGGLYVRYYNNLDLVGLPAFEGISNPNFQAGEGSPAVGVNPDFSARWTGFFRVPTSGKWRFLMNGDDGYRLYINGQLAIDNWRWGAGAGATGYVQYEAGVDYPIWIEFFDGVVNGGLDFQWQPLVNNIPGAVVDVPDSALYADLPDAPADPLPLQSRHYVEVVNRY